MSRQTPWLFEIPLASDNVSLEYEAPLEQEWEISANNDYNVSLTASEWEMLPAKTRVGQTKPRVTRTGGVIARNGKQAMLNQRRQGQNSQLRRPSLPRQVTRTEAGLNVVPPIILDRFERGEYRLRTHHYEPIINLVEKNLLGLNRSDLRVYVIGGTDITGNEALNRGLSVNRAAEVAKLLRTLFISFSMNLEMYVGGVGSKEPVAPNTTEAGRQKNRRVHISIHTKVNPLPGVEVVGGRT